MARKRYSDEDILKLLREIELKLVSGNTALTSRSQRRPSFGSFKQGSAKSIFECLDTCAYCRLRHAKLFGCILEVPCFDNRLERPHQRDVHYDN